MASLSSLRTRSANETITIPVNSLGSSSRNFTVIEIQIPDTYQVAKFYSFGGGPVTQSVTTKLEPIPRSYGGATRNQIYGSARWGSGQGYIYEPDGEEDSFMWNPIEALNRTNVDYPFGFWPICWGNSGYGGSYQYSGLEGVQPGYPSRRPGSDQYGLIVSLLPIPANHASFYYIIADAQSIGELSNILVSPVSQGGCAMQDHDTLYEFTMNGTFNSPMGPDALFHNIEVPPTSVLQYYRTSSVALGNIAYENEYSLDNNTRPGYWGRTDFNLSLLDTGDGSFNQTAQQQFLDCVNHTIAGALPIIDPTLTKTPPITHTLSVGQQIGIGLGLFAFFIFLAGIIWRIVLVRKGLIGSFWSFGFIANQRRNPLFGFSRTVSPVQNTRAPIERWNPMNPRLFVTRRHVDPVDPPPVYVTMEERPPKYAGSSES